MSNEVSKRSFLPRGKFNHEAKARFVELVQQRGLHKARHARACGVSPGTVTKTLNPDDSRYDPEFAEAVEAARWEFTEGLERAAYKRAVEGIEEPVFYEGKVVGTIKRYSDRLLAMLLKKHDPEYRENKPGVNVASGGVLVIQAASEQAPEEWADQFNEAKPVEHREVTDEG